MITNRPPETTIQALDKASKTIEEVAILDRNFPDIGESFGASSSCAYTTAGESTVQPVLSKSTFSLPVEAFEQMQRRKPSGPAGLFPEINRAYFAVGNQLYFWNYNDRQDFMAYEDAHEIINAAIVKPKADVFNKDITHVLIVATTQEINVIALSYKCDENFVDSLTFYKTGIMTSSNGVQMTNILGTKHGRVFMSGNDGNLWELVYKREEGWFTSRCYKTIHTNDYTRFFYNGLHDPCISIAVSDDSQVLYQLTQKSTVKVCYLGNDGQGFNTIAVEAGLGEKARLMCPNSPLVSTDNFAITSIHSTLPAESKSYQMVAITSNGCRLYLSHYKANTTTKAGDAPNGIDLIHVRTPPPYSPPTSASSPNQQSFPTALSSSPPPSPISKCLYNNGVLMLVNSYDHFETLTSACPDIGYLAREGSRSGLHEMYNCQSLPGKILAVTEVTKSPFQLNELVSSTSLGTVRQFLAFTTTGLTLLLKQRPVDMLQNLLMNAGSDIRHRSSTFEQFFDFFNPIQASALCFGIIGRADSTIANGIDLFSNTSPSTDIAKGASDLLDKYGSHASSLRNQFSSRHDGLALYISRLIHPIWNQPIMKEIPSSTAQHQYQSTVDRSRLMAIQQVLRKLQGYLDMKVIMQTDPHSPEELSSQELYELVKLLAEAISFFIYLFDSDFTGIMKKFKPQVHDVIKSMTYKKLLTSSEGRLVSNDFTQALIDQHFSKYNNANVVMDILKQYCGSFCDRNIR
ncbi:Nup133 N terminal like-domain-containing protein [Absidia repens]|uniref:Nup133 N terminal like-domain-containing protein n=1 Tax=Absidia repens TaxID=90262 RepID=A0A1X2HL48_9FUNG|nr:Nup133 N terminal like-domain-containing protein [Absidia repens]